LDTTIPIYLLRGGGREGGNRCYESDWKGNLTQLAFVT